MKSTLMPRKYAHASKWFDVNSVPLSTFGWFAEHRGTESLDSASVTDCDRRLFVTFKA
jgi:hypothetical protein